MRRLEAYRRQGLAREALEKAGGPASQRGLRLIGSVDPDTAGGLERNNSKNGETSRTGFLTS